MVSTASDRFQAFEVDESTTNLSLSSKVGKKSQVNQKLHKERASLLSAVSNHNSLMNKKFKVLEDEIMSLGGVSIER